MKDRMAKPVVCRICGYGRHTLVKVDDGVYQHQNPKVCEQVIEQKRRLQKEI